MARTGLPALRVAAGIVITRLLGLVRERVFAHYFGNGPWADAFKAALRIPNLIRNLLGEGTLSASFIPVFAGLLERGDREAARRLAGVVVSLLAIVTAGATVVGIVAAPLITTVVAPGLDAHTRELTVAMVKIMFPMAGLMILSAWCLGILNSHRRFFLPYAAPAMWNVAQIGTLVALGAVLVTDDLIIALAWGALGGGLIQLLVQLPATFRLLGRLHLSLALATPGVRGVVLAWVPVVLGAGVMQLSSIVDTQLGSLLGTGAIATLFYAQLLALLPISVFGASVAASELPEMSRDASARREEMLRSRVASGLLRIGFFVIPAAFLYASLGGVVVALVLQTGRFGADEVSLVTAVLAAYAIGLPGQSLVKLLASGHYALGDTRTPVIVAVITLVLSAALAFLFMRRFGPAGIALGSSLAVYVNVSLNGRALVRKVGSIFDPVVARGYLKAAFAATVATAVGILARGVLVDFHPWISGPVTLALFALAYPVVALLIRHPVALDLSLRLRGTT